MMIIPTKPTKPKPKANLNTTKSLQDTGAPILEGSRGSEVVTVKTPIEEPRVV